MSKNPTRGQTIALDVEGSGIGSGDFSSPKHFRYDSESLPTHTMDLEKQENIGHENLFQRDDDPQPFRDRAEGGIVTKWRVGASAGDTPPINTMLESACMGTAIQSAATTTSGAPTTTSIPLADDYGAIGQAALVYLDSSMGVYWPTLCAAYGSSTITPSMALPEAPSASQVVAPMHTLIPGNTAVSNKTIGMQVNTRATHTGSEDWAWIHLAMALKSAGALTIRRGTTPTFDATLFSCKRDPSAVALGAADFLDGEKYLRWNDNLEFGFANANAAGGIARATVNWEEAVFDWGIDTQPDEAAGSGTYGNTIGFFPSTAGTPSLKVTGEFLKSYWDNAILASQTRRYMHIVQPTDDLTMPAFGLWLPNCYIAGKPNMLREKNSYYKAEITFECDAAGYGSDTSNDSRGMAPYYLGFGVGA